MSRRLSSRRELVAEVAHRIQRLQADHPRRVAVDGPDMAGKSTLADELAAVLREESATNVIRASVDDFHHPREIRYRRGRTSSEGYYRDAFDLLRLKEVLLDPLGPGGSLRYATAAFNWRADSPVAATLQRAPNDAILLVDGVFLLRPELLGHWDFSIFVWASEEERLARSKMRDAGPENSAENIESLSGLATPRLTGSIARGRPCRAE